MMTKRLQRHAVADASNVHKRLINGVNLYGRGEIGQRLHHPAAEIGIKRIVRAKDVNPRGKALLFEFEIRLAHFYIELLCLPRQRNNAAVVIGDHHHGFAPQIGPKHRLAGGIKAVHINQCEHVYAF